MLPLVTPGIDRFLKLATRSIRDQDDLREDAETELMARIGQVGVPLDQIDLSEASARLEEKVPVDPSRRRWLIVAALLVAMVIGIRGLAVDLFDVTSMVYSESLLWRQIDEPSTHFQIRVPGPAYFFWGDMDAVIRQWMTAGTVDLPLSGKQGDEETALLRRLHPDDLGSLQEHLARRSWDAADLVTGEESKLAARLEMAGDFMTAEERELVRRSDPDNALWPLMEIRWIERVAELRSYSRLGGMNSEEVERCHRLLSQAAACPRLVNHAVGLLQRQKAALPEARGVADLVRSENMARFVTEASTPRVSWKYRSEDWLRLRLPDLASSPDEMRRLKADLIAVEKLRSSSPEAVLYDLTGNFVFMDDARQTLATYLGSGVGLTDYPRLNDYLPFPEREDAGVFMQGTRMLPDDLTAGEMKPLKLAELCLFERFLVWTCAVVMGLVALLTLLESVRRKRVVKALARGLMPLLRRRDYLWIGGLGIVLPCLWYLLVTQILSCGGEWTGSDEGLVIKIMQGGLGVGLSMILILQACEWRWAVRGAFLGLDSGWRIFGWLAALLTALTIPAAGLYLHLENAGSDVDESYLLGCAGAGAGGGLWLLWVAIRNVFTGSRAALRPNLISRTALPWMLAALATIILCAGVLRGVESWWIKQEPLLRLDTSRTLVNAIDERGLVHRCKQVREWIGQQGQP